MIFSIECNILTGIRNKARFRLGIDQIRRIVIVVGYARAFVVVGVRGRMCGRAQCSRHGTQHADGARLLFGRQGFSAIASAVKTNYLTIALAVRHGLTGRVIIKVSTHVIYCAWCELQNIH